MNKYEYKVIFFGDLLTGSGNEESGLNELGVDGWELCATFEGRFIFKRLEVFKLKTEDIMKMFKK